MDKPIPEAVHQALRDAVRLLMAQGRDGLLLADKLNSYAPAIYSALTAAQQQAAMEFDGTDREVLREFIRICREHKPVGQWPGERVCKAIERAMDNEKPFRFIAEADMAPERAPSMKDADRMLSGPRRRSAPPPAATQHQEPTT